MPNIIRFMVEINGAGTVDQLAAAKHEIEWMIRQAEGECLAGDIMSAIWHRLPVGAKPQVGMATVVKEVQVNAVDVGTGLRSYVTVDRLGTSATVLSERVSMAAETDGLARGVDPYEDFRP